jgi:hypothetical protein
MPEDEIRMKVNQYRGWVESDRRRGRETYDVEVELCYLVDELRVRETRKRLHEEYLRSLPVESYEDGYGYYYEEEN